jgi:lipoprotein-anchoring transpeptidase ErfK/SrfK
LGVLALPGAGNAASVEATQPGVELRRNALAHVKPAMDSRVLEHVGATTYYTQTAMVLPVLTRHVDADGRSWVRVRLPYRGHATGWVVDTDATAKRLTYHLVVSLAKRRLTVYHGGKVLARYPTVVGKPSTPTPTGDFFVVEHVRMYSDWADGQWALATSAYSNVLQEFDGGNGQVALHAKASLLDPLGTAASHGCVRLDDSVAAKLAGVNPNGTPLTIS